MTELPTGWTTATVGDIAELADGPFGSNLKTAHYTEDGPRVVRLQNIGEGVFRDERAHITQEHYEQLAKHAVLPGDILAASLGLEAPRACLVPAWLGPAIVKADCVRVRTHDGIAPGFLMWMLNSPPVRKQASSLIKGVGRPRLGLGGIRQLDIPLPPLNEQRRIEAVIEEQFSRLDATDESLERAERRLGRLREALIGAAVSGAWPETPLADVLVSLRNGIFVSRPAAEPPGTAIFRISAVRPLSLDVQDVRYAPISEEECSDYLLNEGDLLFTRYSGNPEYVGACARVPLLPRPTLHPDKLIRVVVDRTKVDPAFVELACAAGITREQIRARRKTTAGQVGIAGGQLKSVPIPLPPLHEQQRIVTEVEQQLSLIDAMRKAVEVAKRRSAALHRSVLERAFQGELVPQDPNDEPAAILLGPIGGERPTAKPRRRGKATA